MNREERIQRTTKQRAKEQILSVHKMYEKPCIYLSIVNQNENN